MLYSTTNSTLAQAGNTALQLRTRREIRLAARDEDCPKARTIKEGVRDGEEQRQVGFMGDDAVERDDDASNEGRGYIKSCQVYILVFESS